MVAEMDELVLAAAARLDKPPATASAEPCGLSEIPTDTEPPLGKPTLTDSEIDAGNTAARKLVPAAASCNAPDAAEKPRLAVSNPLKPCWTLASATLAFASVNWNCCRSIVAPASSRSWVALSRL